LEVLPLQQLLPFLIQGSSGTPLDPFKITAVMIGYLKLDSLALHALLIGHGFEVGVDRIGT
jgi:hypothetical protein